MIPHSHIVYVHPLGGSYLNTIVFEWQFAFKWLLSPIIKHQNVCLSHWQPPWSHAYQSDTEGRLRQLTSAIQAQQAAVQAQQTMIRSITAGTRCTCRPGTRISSPDHAWSWFNSQSVDRHGFKPWSHGPQTWSKCSKSVWLKSCETCTHFCSNLILI